MDGNIEGAVDANNTPRAINNIFKYVQSMNWIGGMSCSNENETPATPST